jgi:hypothetical protein
MNVLNRREVGEVYAGDGAEIENTVEAFDGRLAIDGRLLEAGLKVSEVRQAKLASVGVNDEHAVVNSDRAVDAIETFVPVGVEFIKRQIGHKVFPAVHDIAAQRYGFYGA